MDHITHPRLSPAEMTESNLVGAPVYSSDDEKIGSISHLHATGATQQVVVDVGGFLGIGSKPVLVGISEIDLMRDTNGNVHGVTSWTKERLQALPEHRD